MPELVIAIAAGWAAIGLVLPIVMGRRAATRLAGHSKVPVLLVTAERGSTGAD